ncbi:MAG: GNAT family N-acetyltransferase [Oscillospiraceae bacterium]|jgi:GNAT superfamily N-acetyltransferase|nr:GNAT family N-acetyltransferase [Oscillospiraceae bacterium]
MINDQYIKKIIQGHELYWNMLGSLNGNKNHKGDICWLSGDINYTYKVKLHESDYNAEINKIINKLKNKKIPNNLIITPDSTPNDVNICDLFLKHDCFAISGTNFGMAKEINENNANSIADNNKMHESGIEIFKVSNPYQIKMSGAILNTAFEYDIFSLTHYTDIFNSPRVHFYLAEQKGIPAGACMAIHADDFVEIAWVCTLKGYRKKGIAGYLLNMAEQDAYKKGLKLSVLSAYPEGLNAYIRAGYKQYCEIFTLEYKG